MTLFLHITKLHFPLATVILANFAFLLWDQDHYEPLKRALNVYGEHSNQAAIAWSSDEAFEAFSEHQSYDELTKKVFQIALDNHLHKWVPRGYTPFDQSPPSST